MNKEEDNDGPELIYMPSDITVRKVGNHTYISHKDKSVNKTDFSKGLFLGMAIQLLIRLAIDIAIRS